jgi:hypothetical protein
MGWNTEPNSYVGSHIYLDYWNLFGGEEWEEWRFGFEIVDEFDNVMDWPVLGAVTFTNNEGMAVQEFVVKIPDMPDVMPGQRYSFKIYNQNEAGN